MVNLGYINLFKLQNFQGTCCSILNGKWSKMIIYDHSLIIGRNPSLEYLIKVEGSKTNSFDRPRRLAKKGGLNFAIQNTHFFTFFWHSQEKWLSIKQEQINIFLFYKCQREIGLLHQFHSINLLESIYIFIIL